MRNDNWFSRSNFFSIYNLKTSNSLRAHKVITNHPTSFRDHRDSNILSAQKELQLQQESNACDK